MVSVWKHVFEHCEDRSKYKITTYKHGIPPSNGKTRPRGETCPFASVRPALETDLFA